MTAALFLACCGVFVFAIWARFAHMRMKWWIRKAGDLTVQADYYKSASEGWRALATTRAGFTPAAVFTCVRCGGAVRMTNAAPPARASGFEPLPATSKGIANAIDNGKTEGAQAPKQ